MLPAFSPASRGVSEVNRFFHVPEEEHASFHEHGTFFAIWLLVVFVAVGILGRVRSILEPILWAFFLVMGLVPLTDLVELVLLRLCAGCRRLCGRRRPRPAESKASGGGDGLEKPVPSRSRSSHSELGATLGSGRTGSERSLRSGSASGSSRWRQGPQHDDEAALGFAVGDLEDEDSTDSDRDDSDDFDPPERGCREGGCLRTVAVVLVILSFVGFAALFFIMVYKSAVHMQDSWPHYQRGGQHISARTEAWMATLPDNLLQKLTDKALTGMEEALSSLVGGLLEATTHTLVELLWVLLYSIFWLCQPVHIGKDVSAVFQRYIFLKGLASGGYAFCIWILLHVLGVDLAIVFGLITFVLNFIPEVGPFIAMMLPLPVILFDDRMRNPLQFVALALVGQLALKVVFGNIVEIKLIESQQEMRMHPVVILFFVAFFQFIWGATGMLLSVPIVAALKATLHKIPPAYRNPILIFLEGDKGAPVRWRQWRESVRSSRAAAAALAMDE